MHSAKNAKQKYVGPTTMATLFARSFKPFTAKRAGFMILGMCGSGVPAATARCEGGLPKDSNGNIEWSKIPSSITEAGFWDDVAKSAGESVRIDIDHRSFEV